MERSELVSNCDYVAGIADIRNRLEHLNVENKFEVQRTIAEGVIILRKILSDTSLDLVLGTANYIAGNTRDTQLVIANTETSSNEMIYVYLIDALNMLLFCQECIENDRDIDVVRVFRAKADLDRVLRVTGLNLTSSLYNAINFELHYNDEYVRQLIDNNFEGVAELLNISGATLRKRLNNVVKYRPLSAIDKLNIIKKFGVNQSV